MMEEFQRADGIVRDVYNGVTTWDTLFKRHSFFTKDHKYYLSVIAASRTKEADTTFHGLVQSRVRLLVQGIDDGLVGIEVARPYTIGIERIHQCKDEDQVEAVTKGSLDYMIPVAPVAGTTEDHIIYTMTFYIGLRLPAGMLRLTLAIFKRLTCPAEKTALDISFITDQFRRKVHDSPLYDEKLMSVKVVHTRK